MFEEGLRLIRIRRRRMGYVLGGLLPFVLIAAYPGGVSADMWIPFVAATAAYGALLLAYSLRLAFTECPRCHEYYHWNYWADPLTPKCLHCRLPLDP